jgi:hypothetical protein
MESLDIELDDEAMAEDAEDLKEDLADIDEKGKLIKEFNSKNFKIDEAFLDLYQDYFDKYDIQIAEEPSHNYDENNLPPYYPNNGIWYNSVEAFPNSGIDTTK